MLRNAHAPLTRIVAHGTARGFDLCQTRHRVRRYDVRAAMLEHPTDAAALAISIAQVAAYYLFLRLGLRRDTQFTVHAVNSAARERWVNATMQVTGNGILAVQTLRNSVMSASFMASTAILLMVATLTVASTSSPGGVWHALNPTGATDDRTVALKLALLLGDFFAAFFSFAMAVRYFNHVGYMITASGDGAHAERVPSVVAYLQRAGALYAFGTRAFFFCVPLMFWLFGPYFFIGATAALLLALYAFDRPPRVGRRR